MTLWQRLVNHPGCDLLKLIYSYQFPFDVNFIHADWIVEQITQYPILNIQNDPNSSNKAANFLKWLDDVVNPGEMTTSNGFSVCPIDRYRQIYDTISFLKQIVDFYHGSGSLAPADENQKKETAMVDQKLEFVKQRVTTFKEVQNLSQPLMKTEFGLIILEITRVQCMIVYQMLSRWHQDQKIAAFEESTGNVKENKLDKFQVWFVRLANLICEMWSLNDLIGQRSQLDQSNCMKFSREMVKILTNLVMSGFVVEEQPLQVIKTNGM